MADPDAPPLPPDDPPPAIADASALFRDEPRRAPAPPPPHAAAGDASGGYDLDADPDRAPADADADADDDPPPARRYQLDPDAPGGEPGRARPAPRAARPAGLEPSAAVDQVWSRGAEWGGTLALLALVAAGLLGLIYELVSYEMIGPAFVVLLASAPVLAWTAYPILITLERPVRVTPEQAVRDYYAALSHHAPHYRRMWLLLSGSGRVSGSFASFEGFRSYWKTRLRQLRSGRAAGFTPLKFQVDGFKSEKSAGLTTIDCSYTVNVFVRGRASEGPVESVRVESTLVKGPDRMWYLDHGTLP